MTPTTPHEKEPTLQEKELLEKLEKAINQPYTEVRYAAEECLSILKQEIQKAKEESRKEALREMDKAWVLCMGKNADASDLRHLRVEAGINL